MALGELDQWASSSGFGDVMSRTCPQSERAGLSPAIARDIAHPGGPYPLRKWSLALDYRAVRKGRFSVMGWSQWLFLWEESPGKDEARRWAAVCPVTLWKRVHAHSCVYVHDHAYNYALCSRSIKFTSVFDRTTLPGYKHLTSLSQYRGQIHWESAPVIFLLQTPGRENSETNTHINIPLRIPAFTSLVTTLHVEGEQPSKTFLSPLGWFLCSRRKAQELPGKARADLFNPITLVLFSS